MYRFFDVDGVLLYVGSTSNPPVRWSKHKGDKPWWLEVDAYSLTWWSSRETAYREEYRAIGAEQPKHNERGLHPLGTPQPVTEAALRFADVLEEIAAMADSEDRAVAVSQVLRLLEEKLPELKEARREGVLSMRARKVTYRAIAEKLDVSIGTVQDIERGHSGSWGTKPRRKAASE